MTFSFSFQFDTQEIINCLCKGIKSGESYPPPVRIFAMSLHYLSPRAYNYVRDKFHTNLPHEQTIRQWYRNSDLDASSGIAKNTLDGLQEYAENFKSKTNKQLLVSLIFDEMSIQRSLLWCRSTNKFIGQIDKGNLNENEEFTLASNVIVFMINGLNADIQQPIAFYFIQTLNAKDRANLVMEVIKEISQRGIRVANITFDGYKANATMCESFGANLTNPNGEYVTSFLNPYDGSKIRIIFDPSHMMKLWRNTLGDRKILYDGKDKIEWNFFIRLVEMSRNKNLGMSHKMNKRHLQYADRKMHVRTAVETLSQSVADSMDVLRKKGLPEFANANATVKMIRICDSLWDVMNTQGITNPVLNIFKSAINPSNKRVIFSFLLEAKRYISSLKVINRKTGKRQLLINSERKTAFRGFIVNIISIMEMYEEFVETHQWMECFPCSKISQDPVEIFFGDVRSSNGHNDNPNTAQFISAYRKLLLQLDISTSSRSNVTDLCRSNVINVSSRTKSRKRSGNPSSSLDQASFSPLLHQEEYEELNLMEVDGGELDQGIIYMSSALEKRLLECDQVYCSECISVIRNDRKVNEQIVMSTKFNMPSESIYRICKAADEAIVSNLSSGSIFKEKVYNAVMNNINWEDTFADFSLHDPDHDTDHKHFLIKFFIDEFVHKKCAYIAKQKTIDLQKRYNRNRLRKLGHNKHL